MSLPVCKFYKLNKCKFGKNCKFLHLETQHPLPVQAPIHNEESVRSPSSVKSRAPVSNISPSNQGNNQNEAVRSGNSEQPSQSIFSSRYLETAPKHQNATKLDLSGNQQAESIQTKGKVCVHFARNGYCLYGKSCRFQHIPNPQNQHHVPTSTARNNKKGRNIPPRFKPKEHSEPPLQSSDIGGEFYVHESTEVVEDALLKDVRQQQARSKSAGKKTRPKVCRYFLAGHCNLGRRCRFSHVSNQNSKETEENVKNSQETPNEGVTNTRENRVTNQHFKPRAYVPPTLKQVFELSELKNDGTKQHRQAEIRYIESRLTKDKMTVLQNDDDGDYQVSIILSPSDPDWPYDIRDFQVEVTLPKEYPKEMMKVALPMEQDLPATVRRYIGISIKEWVEERFTTLVDNGKAELVMRPFLRWFDRKIEDLSTEALKQLKRELVAHAAGMEFIPAHQLKERFETKNKSESSDGVEEEEDSDDGSETEEDSDDDDETDSDDGDSNEDEIKRPQNLDPDKKGTELALKNLQLKEKVAALMFEKLKIILQCGRCKTHSELLIPQGKVVSIECGKCHNNQFAHYRAALIHQFSSVVGYLDLDGCQAFDLILQDCRLQVTCMNCSKQTKVDGLISGQLVDGWCQACNARFRFATDAAKFSNLAPSVLDSANTKVDIVNTVKSKKPPKDPAIREGCPLPEFGTCKHYKQSYRWLRFPCCGKAYPCDVCHDKKEDHEMQLANRMICGHCCKEQNYSASRPCTGCSQHLTKIRSAHWEGGKGCRDKISMGKNDQQKYRGMSKTVSQHKKAVGSSKKKNIKLRHA